MKASRRIRLIGQIALFVLLWAGAPPILDSLGRGAPEAEAAEPVTLSMSWVFVGRHSWYFAAEENGYFREADLAVKIIRGHGGGDTVKKLSAGSFEFAEIDTGNVIVARARGSKVKMISVHLIKAPFGIFSLKGSGITRPKDLEGKTIGAGDIDAMRVLFPPFARKAGIDPARVKWTSMIPAAKVGALKTQKVDAITGFVDTFGGALSVQGLDFRVLRYSDHGFDILASGMVTTDPLIAGKPALVKRFLTAVNRGIVWTIKNQDGAIQAMRKHHPELNGKILREQLEITPEFMGDVNQPRFGWIDPERMRFTRDTTVAAMKLKNVALEDIYTNQFIQ